MKQLFKICHIQLLPLLSGVQRSMLEILKRLDRRVYELSVICKEEGDLTAELQRLQIRYHIIPSLQREINLYHDSRALLQLYGVFKRERYDLIHTHSSKTGLLGRMAAYMAGVPHIFHTVHGLPFHEFSRQGHTRLYTLFERFAGKLTDRVIFVNNEERIYAVQRGILKADQVCTIYNGVNLNFIDNLNKMELRKQFRERWKIPPDAFVAAFVGRLWEQKDPQTLAGIVAACSDLPIHFLIVGDGPFFDRFQKVFCDQPRVILTGWLDDCMPMYPAIDLLLLPSLWEGLSVTLIEAMAFGKPLVASNIKGNRECVIHGDNGYLCTPQQPQEFKKAIEKLLLDKSLYQSMAQSCLRFSRRLFDIEANSSRLIALYEERLGHAPEK
jgi:glycosyltransferase involved in cell wall biosynthesis